jgi:hypothetical protein
MYRGYKLAVLIDEWMLTGVFWLWKLVEHMLQCFSNVHFSSWNLQKKLDISYSWILLLLQSPLSTAHLASLYRICIENCGTISKAESYYHKPDLAEAPAKSALQ